MKQFLLILILLPAQFCCAQTEIDFDGFADIRLGMTFSKVKRITVKVDEAPAYAWFQPSTDEEMRERYGDDADFYIQIRDEQTELFSELNLERRWCIPKKKANRSFFNLEIECIECVFAEGVLIKITVVLDKSGISLESKELLKMDMRDRIPAEPFCSGAANYVPQPTTCWWYSDEDSREIVFSDASEMEGAPGESVNIVFGRLF